MCLLLPLLEVVSIVADFSIAALPVLDLDLKIVSARIADCRKKKTSAREYEKEALAIQQRIDGTKKYLKEGGSHARSGAFSLL